MPDPSNYTETSPAPPTEIKTTAPSQTNAPKPNPHLLLYTAITIAILLLAWVVIIIANIRPSSPINSVTVASNKTVQTISSITPSTTLYNSSNNEGNTKTNSSRNPQGLTNNSVSTVNSSLCDINEDNFQFGNQSDANSSDSWCTSLLANLTNEFSSNSSISSDNLGVVQAGTYNEQLLMSLLNYTSDSLAYNVTIVTQSDKNNIGPAYLLNGVSDTGYWYQTGVSYNWSGSNIAGKFAFIYQVFNPEGISIFPDSSAGQMNFSGIVNTGDTILLRLQIHNNMVTMSAYDWNTKASASTNYKAENSTNFLGLLNTLSGAQTTQSSDSGQFTGLMTEWWHTSPYYGSEKKVVYVPYGQSKTLAGLAISESTPSGITLINKEYLPTTSQNSYSLSADNITLSFNNGVFTTGP